MCARVKMPFEYKRREEFQEKLVEWVGDILYDFLPEHEYEVRDEQIFTAFQIADAMCEKKVHLAEAGLGTGKTFAYLLSAIPYARMTGKPVVIACASTALQEQLAAEEGDIMTLSKLLGLEVDARMAKDPAQYLCDVKIEETTGDFEILTPEMSEWVQKTKLGERSELPTIPDQVWKKISWDESMPCDTCMNRGYCKLVKAREVYRTTSDLIIVDHETFFHDLWTRQDRILDGKLPILPEYSAVIFDEGHKILLPASMQAGHSINEEDMNTIINTFAEIQGARESLENVIVALEQASDKFFEVLNECSGIKGSSNRRQIQRTPALIQAAKDLKKMLDHLLLEMQIEQELYFESVPTSLIQAYEGQIERAIPALNGFLRNDGKEVIAWVQETDGSFWVVPKHVNELLQKHLYSKKIPVIFTSATLSNHGDFDYFARTMGIKQPSKSTIGSPFDIEHQVKIELSKTKSMETLIELLKENGGRALVLTDTLEEVAKIRDAIGEVPLPFELLWEDTADRGYLVRKFKEDEASVLIGADFWEGIDVPGEALTLVIIWSLPFPELDPLIEAQKEEAKLQGLDPVTTVEYPEMGLKLKQGCGRLIRTESDHGKIVVLDKVKGTPWESVVMGALPEGAEFVIE